MDRKIGSLSQLQASLKLEPVHSRAPVKEAPQLFIILGLESDLPFIQQQVHERAGVQDASDEGECEDPHCEDAVGCNPGCQARHSQSRLHEQEEIRQHQPEPDLQGQSDMMPKCALLNTLLRKEGAGERLQDGPRLSWMLPRAARSCKAGTRDCIVRHLPNLLRDGVCGTLDHVFMRYPVLVRVRASELVTCALA